LRNALEIDGNPYATAAGVTALRSHLDALERVSMTGRSSWA